MTGVYSEIYFNPAIILKITRDNKSYRKKAGILFLEHS